MEGGFGGGQPSGLAAASAWGRRPPKAGGGPTKYRRDPYLETLCIKLVLEGKDFYEAQEAGIEGMVGFGGMLEGGEDNIVVLDANHGIISSFVETFYGGGA